MIAVSAIETAEIRAVMDANDATNVGFMADASLGFMADDAAMAAVAELNTEATVLLSAKKDECLLRGSATCILPGLYFQSYLQGCIRSFQRFCRRRGLRCFLFAKNTFVL